MNKKGALDISVQTIVIIVIAFVVLSLGLIFTRGIFKEINQELPGVFESTRLDVEPTPENPITLLPILETNRKKTETIRIGFYNKGQGTATNALLTIKRCLKQGNEPVSVEFLPTITSVSADVPVSESKGYSVILSENGLPAGQYICEIAVKCEKDCPSWMESEFYEVKQFILKVIV